VAYDPEMVWDLLIYLIIGGVIGAASVACVYPTPSSGVTTYYYLTHPLLFHFHLDIIEIWRAGWAFPARIIGGGSP